MHPDSMDHPAGPVPVVPGRPPLDVDQVRRLLGPGTPFRLEHRSTTDSTQRAVRELGPGRAPTPRECPADVMAVVVAEEQSAGRGRLGRSWTSPPGAGLTFSVAAALPRIPVPIRSWVGAVLGLAALAALDRVVGLPRPELKWPNDVLVSGRKCAGILAELDGDRVIVGMGLNVLLTAAELPRNDTTSLSIAGAVGPIREVLLADILLRFADLLADWNTVGGDVDRSGVRRAYLDRCATVGGQVRIDVPGGGSVTGRAVDVDATGRLVLAAPDGRRTAFGAGDVVHAAVMR